MRIFHKFCISFSCQSMASRRKNHKIDADCLTEGFHSPLSSGTAQIKQHVLWMIYSIPNPPSASLHQDLKHHRFYCDEYISIEPYLLRQILYCERKVSIAISYFYYRQYYYYFFFFFILLYIFTYYFL